ncbi:uncharacterized protein LOC128237669 [Mya arenaria]|uniref:uncharacterized protein LOC128237669 n=1 Tax=Mya arenaria TaxID=6604 RepID=UPI0022DFC81A|nr:uncharacterized protein LOC128237669 [Mya arenaria]
MLLNQKQNLNRNPKGRRWDKNTISLCLSLWCRSQKNYEQLRNSKILTLPSGRWLSYYKGVVDQKAGFNKDVFLWMKNEARKLKKSTEDEYLGVLFISMDGAQTNRDFMHLFFEKSTPKDENFSTKNIWSPHHPDIIFIMDFSHVIKRIRNNILKSGDTKSCTRILHYNNPILWDHWIQAYKWDRDNNSFPIHRKLTNEHFYLTQESKMRNKLAEETLNGDMLHLMECFQNFLGDNGHELDDTIALLKATSVVISIFRDTRPINDVFDERLDQLETSLSWFNKWESHIKRSTIVPARVNSDVIENIFCQQRGIVNGNNTNPNFYQYSKNINTILFGQNAVSKNSNAEKRGCEPLCFNIDMPINPKKRKTVDSAICIASIPKYSRSMQYMLE